jgi:uncharacterized membrane protein
MEKEISSQVFPELRDLFIIMEQTFQPLEIATFLKTKFKYFSTVPVFKQYSESLLRVAVIKIFQQVRRLQFMKFSFIPFFILLCSISLCQLCHLVLLLFDSTITHVLFH